MSHPVVIGRNECVDLINITTEVPAKIDSGAYRSSIHCKRVRLVRKDGKEMLEVKLLGHPCAPETYDLTFKNFEKVKVTNSFGHEEERYEVKLRVKIGPKIFSSSFTLANRSNNLFPILVGRKVLKQRFIVDVSRGTVNRVELKKRFGIKTPLDEEDLEE